MSRPKPQEIDTRVAVIGGKLDVLAEREAELQAILDSIRAERLALQVEYDDLQSKRVPFNWLPPELVTEIFLYCTEDSHADPEAPFDRIPVALSHVSRRWRSVALATPALWRRLHLQLKDAALEGFTRPAVNTFVSRRKSTSVQLMYSDLAAEDDELDYGLPVATLDDSSNRLHLFDQLVLTSLVISGGPNVLLDGLMFLRAQFLPTAPGALFHHFKSHLNLSKSFRDPFHSQSFPCLKKLTLRDVSPALLPITNYPELRELTVQVVHTEHMQMYMPGMRVQYLARVLAGRARREALVTQVGMGVRVTEHDAPGTARAAAGALLDGRTPGGRLLPSYALSGKRAGGSGHQYPGHREATRAATKLRADRDTTDNTTTKCGAAAPCACYAGAEDLAGGVHVVRRAAVTVPQARIPGARDALPRECRPGARDIPPSRAASSPPAPRVHLPRPAHAAPDTPHPVRVRRARGARGHDVRIHARAGALDCDMVEGGMHVLTALATTRRGSTRIMRCCPALRTIHLWECNDVHFPALERLIKLRNGFAEPDSVVPVVNGHHHHRKAAEQKQASASMGERKIKPLKRSVRGAQIPQGLVGVEEMQPCVPITDVRIEKCKLISEEQARSLEKWGVDVVWG
ncbi:hypothetical protein EVG20_g78 [Dentipellis fragilis]|uniref:F-box domain-containing protein n=1 Tax=Dentipellis fragilis TaxID=205917 RepID=A0A4Y9ZGL1_9AGAM|nr:hypothetical protein EVG20_g78 [Dentipellis fragilis]